MKQVLVGRAPGQVLMWLGDQGAGHVMRPAVWSSGKADKQGKEHMCVLPHMNGTEMDEKSGDSLVKKEGCGWKEKVCDR